MNKLLLLLWLVAATPAFAQRIETLSLADVIGMAQQKSPAYARARNTCENNYWRYRNYRASMLPALNLNGTLPNLNRSIERITLPDGSDAFVDRSLATSSAVLSIDQNLPLTGGRFSVLSGLQRIDLFGATNSTSFLSTPISISYFQNNVFYNDFRWQRRIEPLVFEEARRAYAEQMEDIALQATNLFLSCWPPKQLPPRRNQPRQYRYPLQNFERPLRPRQDRRKRPVADRAVAPQRTQPRGRNRPRARATPAGPASIFKHTRCLYPATHRTRKHTLFEVSPERASKSRAATARPCCSFAAAASKPSSR